MQSLVLLLWLGLCAEQDVRERQIANVLTLGAAALALAYLFVTGHTWIGAEPTDAAVALVLNALQSNLVFFFTPTQVDAARERARHDPHPFWAGPTILSDLEALE